jgi:acetyltransferase-like isoleucine patch superfamily enzyme
MGKSWKLVRRVLTPMVVSGTVPPNSVVLGNPAKVIFMRG